MENRSTHLSTRVPADLRQRFAAAAAQQGVSESALLRRLVVCSIAVTDPYALGPLPPPVVRNTRITVRLVRDDRLLLRDRAASRGMPAAAYVSTLVRAHLRSLAPLPQKELDALKFATSQLVTLGRNLNVMARAAAAGGTPQMPGRDHVLLLLRICQDLAAHVQGIVRANISSWESGHAKDPR